VGWTYGPANLLHGDENGLIKVPEEGRDRLPELAAKLVAAEKKVADFVKSDNFTIQGLKDLMTY
jgi:regulator of RNase E activity RraA